MLSPDKPLSRRIENVEREGNRLVMHSEHGILALEPQTDDIVRVLYTVQNGFSDRERPGIICGVDTGTAGQRDEAACKEHTGWDFYEDEEMIRLCLPHLIVRVDRDTSAVSYYRADGNTEESICSSDGRGSSETDRCLLFKEREDLPREFEEFMTYRLAGAEQKTRTVNTADGQKEVIEEPLKIGTGKSYHIRFHFELQDEAVYGLGQQEKGFASLRGRTLYIHQANRKIAVPMFVSTKGYGILMDTYAPMIFSDSDDGSYLYLEAGQELDYYFIAGDMNGVIRGYRYLTGKAALLPKWAYGYIQSQERYESQQEILETVKRFHKLGIGVDCIVLDWLSWPDGKWGQKSFDPERFPDPKGMIDELHDMNTRFMISIWPNMAPDTDDHKEFADRGLLLPACSIYDAFKKEARELYFDQLERTHFSYGTDAWWCDSSEPFTPEWNHQMRMEEGDLYREYCREAGLRLPYEYSNAFPLYHAMGIYENQRRSMREEARRGICEKRVCNLTRSACTGQQRYGTIMWSGDTAASWETYRDQIAIGLHFSASGLPYWTMDTGAFFVKQGNTWYWDGDYDRTLEDPDYCELYTRWYQYSAFLPVFRAHGTDCRREPWNFTGKFYEAILAANRLRYRLMPYIYSEAGKVWLYDRSMIRFLSFDHTDDRKTWEITDQFLFGEALMVCPVVESADRRTVYFPEGCRWYDFHTGKRYEGGNTVEVPAPLDTIPVFVKEGYTIPLAGDSLTGEPGDGIRWWDLSGTEGTYELYEDAGDGYGYETGDYTVTVVRA